MSTLNAIMLSAVVLNAVMLSVVVLSAIMLNVVVLSVVAQMKQLHSYSNFTLRKNQTFCHFI